MTKKNISIIAAFICLGVAVLGYYQYTKNAADLSGVAKETVTNKDMSVAFSYPAGERGFSLVESSAPESGLLKGYVLIPTKEYEDFQKNTEPGEGPMSVSVFVYQLDGATTTATSGEKIDRITRLQNWAMDNNTLTSFNVAKNPPEIVEVDGVKAFHYQADGLYQQEIYIASYKNRVYMFTSSYDSKSDITQVAFPDLIKTVAFD